MTALEFCERYKQLYVEADTKQQKELLKHATHMVEACNFCSVDLNEIYEEVKAAMKAQKSIGAKAYKIYAHLSSPVTIDYQDETLIKHRKNEGVINKTMITNAVLIWNSIEKRHQYFVTISRRVNDYQLENRRQEVTPAYMHFLLCMVKVAEKCQSFQTKSELDYNVNKLKKRGYQPQKGDEVPIERNGQWIFVRITSIAQNTAYFEQYNLGCGVGNEPYPERKSITFENITQNVKKWAKTVKK